MTLSAHAIEQRRAGKIMGHRVVFHTSTPSTQMDAQRLLEEGAEHGTLIVAERQTAGRGRRGNKWYSESGGLYFSLVLRPDLEPAKLPRITLLTGAALVDALMSLGADAWSKWPNDVLLSAGTEGPLGPFRKVGGVLSELASSATGVTGVALGVGINLSPPDKGFPDELKLLAGTLKGSGIRAKELDVLDAILDALEVRLKDPADEQGFLDALELLRSRSASLGRRVAVDDDLVGIADAIDQDGALIVRDDDGEEHSVIAGDVRLATSASESSSTLPQPAAAEDDSDEDDSDEADSDEGDSDEDGSDEGDSAEDDSAEDDSGEDDSAEDDSAEDDSAEDDSAEDDSAEDDSAEDDSAEDDSAEDDSGEDDSGEDDSAEDDSGEDDSGEDDPGEGDSDADKTDA